ncbi:MAG TPA: helix-turn-helix domain-containing protein [Roseiarcus sp.]|nr:helix-turn-helix domain-containing protein [Roseiarcus sp.]
MKNKSSLKEHLIELRKELGLTQQEMAEKLDMALRSYQAIEAGESEYRSIHRLAAERVALIVAVEKRDAMLAPAPVRRDAIELVRVGELTGRPDFVREKKKGSPTHAFDDDVNAGFRSAYGVVGELVLLTTALDHQLNHVLISVLHLTDSPLLESVIATLDMVRKIEMVKERSKHISQPNWQKPIIAYVEKLERISKWRNIACHTPLIPDDKHGAIFAPTAAAKLLKNLQLGGHATGKRIPISDLKPQINLGESALFDGQELIQNFRRMNAERIKRHG